MTRVIGLMSGTSVDGIDAALVEIGGLDLDLTVELVAAIAYPYPKQLRAQILAVCAGAALSMAELAALDDAIAQEFALAAQALPTSNTPVALIGSHGQTVYHRPPGTPGNFPLGYTRQLGRGEVIARLTGIKTVSDLRVADMAAGGQGAPLVPKVDAYLLSSPTEHRCIQNLGGIGNVAYLPARQGDWLTGVFGWDTGPGNALLDLAVQQFSGGSQTYDQDGNWAASGTPCQALVEQWLRHDFFKPRRPNRRGGNYLGLST